LVDEVNTNIFDLTVRLFDIWIELDYFEKAIKEVLNKNPNTIEKFLEVGSLDNSINSNYVA
jgi:hypothetical protein